MPIDPQIENYLARLDRALGPIAVSERSDIVTEIKSHILSAQDRDANQPVSKILSSLGEPETVANRYLMERGLKVAPPPKTPMVKWITIGFLGTLGLGVFLILALVYRFTPLISVDESKGRVQLLGGTIDINENMLEGLHIEGVSVSDNTKKIQGEQVISPKTKEINVTFLNGKMEITPTDGNKIYWECKIAGGDAKIENKNTQFIFDVSSAAGTKCSLRVPKFAGKLVVKGGNGKLELDRLQNATEASLAMGKIDVRPDRQLEYRYDAHVGVGKVETLRSSSSAKALPIALHVGTGKIASE
jgi:hypothetical protein